MADQTSVLGRAVEFIPDGEMEATLMSLVATVRASVMTDYKGRRVIVPGEMERLVKERLEISCRLYTEMRDPGGLNWVHRKAIDFMPLMLRCAIDGADWRAHIPDPDSDVWCRTTLGQFDEIVLG